MESWLKGIAGLLVGGLFLFWHPGLETAQNSFTSALNISGQIVPFIWVFLSFVWAFIGALVGHAISATLLFYFKTRRWRLLHNPIVLLLAIAVALTLGYGVMRQLGYDARTIQVVDMETNEVRSFRVVTVLPRDAISAITDPSFVPAAEAIQWMHNSERVIGLEIGGEAKAYPINILSRHEIVNDVVGGKSVAVTW